MSQLLAWKSSERRKPLLLEGPRQVGKTWLLKEFGAAQYDNVAYLDFESTSTLRAVFEADFDAGRIIRQLELATGEEIMPGSTLIVLDEIQACAPALTALKYFNERANDYHIACAGSLLGVALHEQASFPVGKVNFLPVGPLTFIEFLRVVNQSALADAIIDQDWALLIPFHERLVGLLREYLFIGGMPEVVAGFVQTQSFSQVRENQGEILRAYDRDFSKHAPVEQVPRIRSVWGSIPRQLARESRQFVYRQVEATARGRTHFGAIEWLTQAGVVVQVSRVSVPRIPLSAYAEVGAFKLFLCDVGLLGALAGLSPSTIIDGNQAFVEFKGALTEQYAAQQLLAAFGPALYYWANPGKTAEIDFLVQRESDVVPIEVKANRNLKSKSLGVYRALFAPRLSVRSSLASHAEHGTLVDLPLYGLSSLSRVGLA